MENTSFTGRFWRLIQELIALRIPLYAANAGFFTVLSVFPALVLLLSLLNYTDLQLESLLEILRGVIPEVLIAEIQSLIREVSANASGAVVGVSALTMLWSASRGVYGLLLGLNAVYGVKEHRGYLRTRLISAACTLAFLLILLLVLIVHVCAVALMTVLRSRPGSVAAMLAILLNRRRLVLLAVQALLFALMFRLLPDHRCRFRQTLPGALFASLGWLIFGDLYGIYVTYFTPLSSIYGSVYALVLGMLWLYCCLNILFYGGALNRYLEKGRKPSAA